MNQNQISSLYTLIKEQVKLKGKLKIVSDFDECLFLREATAHHILFQELTGKQVPFAKFFEEFWSKAEFKYEGYIATILTSGIPEIEVQRRKNPEETLKKTKVTLCREKEDLYDDAPPLSITADLTKALQEGLVS